MRRRGAGLRADDAFCAHRNCTGGVGLNRNYVKRVRGAAGTNDNVAKIAISLSL
jgi:hypothetical protein